MLLEVQNLKTYYYTRRCVVKAVDDVSFKFGKGSIIGVLGESGCGKSTLGLSILRLIRPPGRIVGGRILFNNEDLLQKNENEMRLVRGERISMIFQDPTEALNPLLKIGDHITETLNTHGKNEDEAQQRVVELLNLVGIQEERADDYPHQLSGGMKQRILIALALALNPDLVVADEPTTALDAIIQAQILRLLRDLTMKMAGLSLMLITHDAASAAEICNKIIIAYAGKIVESGDMVSLYENPLHPYTQGLMAAIPTIHAFDYSLKQIPGSPPDLGKPPGGCRFHPRCPYGKAKCSRLEPKDIEVKPKHFVHCFLYD